MERIFKKIIATSIVAIMILLSCSQVISHATTFYVSTRSADGKQYKFDNEDIYDFYKDSIKNHSNDYYCLKGDAPIGVHYGYEEGYNSYDIDGKSVEDIERDTGVEIRDKLTYHERYAKITSKEQSLKALKWLGRNMYLISSDMDNNQKDAMKAHLNKIINHYFQSEFNMDSFTNEDDELIGIIQQFVIWQFVKPIRNESYYFNSINSVNDVKKIKKDGSQISGEKAEAGYSLYVALVKAAIDYAVNSNTEYDLQLTSENEFNINKTTTEDVDIRETNSTQNGYEYEIGPIKLTYSNLEEFKVLLSSNNNINISNIKIQYNNGGIGEDNSWESLTDGKTNFKGREIKYFKLKFNTSERLDNSSIIYLNYEYKYNYSLKDCSEIIYYKEGCQPLIEFSKKLDKIESKSKVPLRFNYKAPEINFDIALTKHIISVERYKKNSATNNAEKVFDSQGKKGDPSRMIKMEYVEQGTTNKYIMNKTPMDVLPGDIVTYRLTIINEGNVDGIVKEVTDFLPTGLEYVGISSTIGIIDNVDSSNPRAIKIKFSKLDVPSSNYEKPYIDIKCKVSEQNTQNKELVNYAAITDYGYMDINNYIKCNDENYRNGTGDIDSYDNNLNENIWNENIWNENMNLDIIKEIYKGRSNINLCEIDKGDIAWQDDEDFEILKVGYFDLALRKFISSINGVEYNRSPKVDGNTLKAFAEEKTTAEYKHSKNALDVKSGETIVYTIRIFNEGFIDGYAKIIRDYLPTGLKLAEDSQINSTYGWGAVQFDGSRRYIETEYLINETIKASEGIKGFKKVVDSNSQDTSELQEEDKFYKDVQIECVIDDSVTLEQGKILTNMAEITSYGYEIPQINTLQGNVTKVEWNYIQCNSNTKNDIDSEENTLQRDLNNKGYNSVTTESYLDYQNREHNNSFNNDNYFVGLQDDDDFENVKVSQVEFDLALRKFITKIEHNGVETELTGSDSRVPQIDDNSANRLKEKGTANYLHRKDYLQVCTGDFVTYQLRIYNEGSKEGVVKQIVDYIPEGLELADDNDDNWQVSSDQNGVLNGYTRIERNFEEVEVNPSNGYSGYKNYVDNGGRVNTPFWYDVSIKCKVTSTIDGKKLVNRAEISDYGYKNANNEYIQAINKNVDRDSEQNNAFENSKINHQDDDDFENVVVKANKSLKIKINKIEEKSNANDQDIPIEGTTFYIGRIELDDSLVNIDNLNDVNNIISYIKPDDIYGSSKGEVLSGDENDEEKNSVDLKYNTNYFYALREIESSTGYENIFEGYTVIIPTYIDSDGQVQFGVKQNDINDILISNYMKNNVIIFKLEQESYSLVNKDNEIYNKINVVKDSSSTNDTESVPKMIVTMQNKKIDGKFYKLQIEKRDGNISENGSTDGTTLLTGKKFTAILTKGKTINSSENAQQPETLLQEQPTNLRGRKETSPISIDSDGTDEIAITEIEDTDDNYIELQDPVYIYITKTVADGVTDVSFANGQKLQDVTLKDGTLARVKVEILENKPIVKVTIPNKKIDGSYNLTIEKLGEGENSYLNGVEFEVTPQGMNPINITTEGEGKKTVFETSRKIESEGTDTYTIKEIRTLDGYVELDEDIIVNVQKIKDNNNTYNVEAKFDNNENQKNVTTKNGEQITVKILEITENNIIIQIPNKKMKGEYSIAVVKSDSNSGNKLSGFDFSTTSKVKVPGEGNYTVIDGSGTTQLLTGMTKLLRKVQITDISQPDEISITEVSTTEGTNYLKLKNPIKLYLYKGVYNNKYKVTSISFEGGNQGSNIKLSNVALENSNETVDVNAQIKGNTIYIYVPNKQKEEITGKYSLELLKTKEDKTTPIQGAKFTVTKGTETKVDNQGTDENGKIAIVTDEEINSENASEKDVYTIREVSAKDGYLKIVGDLKVYVTKAQNTGKTEYIVSSVSFDEQSEVMQKEVTLEDGSKVTVTLENEAATADKAGTIRITIPNKGIEGNYGLKIVKTGENNQPLQNVKFRVSSVENNRTNEIEINPDVTDENGLLTVFTNKQITKDNVEIQDKYKVSEISVNERYSALSKDLQIYVNKKLNTEKTAYVIDYVSFKEDANKNTQIVSLTNGEKVTVSLDVQGNMVVLTIPNKKIEGEYILKIKKEDENNEPINGAEFGIKINGGDEIQKTTTASLDGQTSGLHQEITSENLETVDTITIREIKVNNKYIMLESPIELYVRKGISNGKYVATSISFDANSVGETQITLPNVALQNSSEKVTISARISEDGKDITVTIPNKEKPEITGNYGLKIVKTGENNQPLQNVKFRVSSVENNRTNEIEINPDVTDVNGSLTVFTNKQITKDNVGIQDKYKVSEISVNERYSALSKDLQIYVNKKLNTEKTAYVIDYVSFKEDANENTQIVSLTNGEKVTVSLDVQGNMVVLTIPNKKIEGKFDLDLFKLDQKDEKTVLPGVTFDITVTKDGKQVKLYDVNNKEINTKGLTTDNKGKISLSNVKITEGTSYIFKITETKVPNGFVMLKDPININVTTKIDSNTNSYVIDSKLISGSAKIASYPNKVAIVVLNGQFDLALRKYISKATVNADTQNAKTVQLPNRIPTFKITEDGKYVYEHSKDTVLLGNGNVVEYTLRVYNEGSISGYASKIKDDIPEGLEFIKENSTNKKYGWVLLDEKGNVTEEVNKAKYIVTDYLSKEKEETPGSNLINKFNLNEYKEGKITEPNYKEVKVAFKVTMPNTEDRIIINKAQISEHTDDGGNSVTDIDSTPDKWIDGEDDQDIEKIKVQYFDLALRKWITKAIVTEDGKQTVQETGHKAEDNPEQIVKVDLKDSKINNVQVQFEYKIRVTNEGQIAGYAKEISDYIPEGLKFVKEDNPDWTEAEGKIVTTKLENTMLQPGESAEVSVTLTWINRKDNLGLKQNVAEISKDYNIFGTPDIDSTPNNKVTGEDDIDDAPVMLTVKTGQIATYVGIAIASIALLGAGVVTIKKYVIK